MNISLVETQNHGYYLFLLDQLVLINDPFSAPDMEKLYDIITDYFPCRTQKEPNFIHAFFSKGFLYDWKCCKPIK